MNGIHTSVREKVDPYGSLPLVEATTTDYSELGLTSVGYTLSHDRVKIGSMVIADSGEGSKVFHGIRMQPQYRGRGFGMAAYVLAIESAHAEGVPFETDDQVSLRALKVWNGLVHVGVAQVIEPFRYGLTTEEGISYYHGLYRAAPGEITY